MIGFIIILAIVVGIVYLVIKEKGAEEKALDTASTDVANAETAVKNAEVAAAAEANSIAQEVKKL